MSLKIKLTSTILAFCLILGLLVMGVFATSQATVNLGGSLSFSATNVHAKVTGNVSGAENSDEANSKLPVLTFAEGKSSTEESQHQTDLLSWGDVDLQFASDGAAISIVLTIENLADRALYATVSPASTMSNEINSSMLIVETAVATEGTAYTGGLISLGNKATETAIKYVRITMSVKDLNKSLSSSATWGYKIDLKDDSAIPAYNQVEGLTITCTEGQASITGNTITGENVDLVIPAYVKDESGNLCPVTSIAAIVFQYSASLISVTIPETVTSIKHYAFNTLSNLANVNYLGDINSWVSINFSNTNANPISNDVTFTIKGEKVTKAVIDKATSIKEYAFSHFVYLESVTLGNQVTSIGSAAFQKCSGLTSVTIGNGVTSIGEYAFSECSGLTSITIPDSVTSIGSGAFRNCSGLTDIYYADSESEWTSLVGETNIGISDRLTAGTLTIHYNSTGPVA